MDTFSSVTTQSTNKNVSSQFDSNFIPIRITTTNTSNDHISNISHINENGSFSISAASTITSEISFSNGNQSNPTTSTSTVTISVAPAQPHHS